MCATVHGAQQLHEKCMLAGIGEVQLQNILALHCKLSHCSMHICAVMLGLKLRHHHMLRLYYLHSRLLKEGEYATHWIASADQLSDILRSHVLGLHELFKTETVTVAPRMRLSVQTK